LHAGDPEAVRAALQGSADPLDTAAAAIEMIRRHTAAGGDPLQGTTNGGEGWHNNPAYAAVDVPVALRFIEHFRLWGLAPRRPMQYRDALLKRADFRLETLGGSPLDWDMFRANARRLWPNRLAMLVPLVLRARAESQHPAYAEAARLIFDEALLASTKSNPHGYFCAWGQAPTKAELFDTNYNMAAYDRGLIDIWSAAQWDVIDRVKAASFAAAQARYLVFSGQFLDTPETDNMTAVPSHFPGGIPSGLGLLSLLLYDDFDFYRGLLGEPIRWGVIDDGGAVAHRDGRRNFYTLKIGSRGALFWAYGVGRDTAPSNTARDMLARWRTARPSPSAK
jgi:hypothetical protein